MVTVRATTITNRALLWEQRPGQDDVWITADGNVRTVPLTPAVQRLIASGALAVVNDAPAVGTSTASAAGDLTVPVDLPAVAVEPAPKRRRA